MEMNQEHIETLDAESYYLRTPDDQIYGPADLATIQQWVREGRIDPDQHISADQQDWTPVTEIPALEFDWLLILPDGTEAGPFHIAMLEEQVAAGNIPTEATFMNRHTQESKPATAPAPQPTPDAPAATPEDTDAPQPATDPETAPTAAPADIPAAAAPDDDVDLPVSLRLETLARHAAEAREQLAETRTSLQQIRMQNTLLQDQNQHLQDRITAAESERDAAESNQLGIQDSMTQFTADNENLQAQLTQIQEHYEKLQLENQRQFEQIDSLRATAMTAEQTWKRELSLLQTALEDKTRVLAEIAEVLFQDAPQLLPPAAAPPIEVPSVPTARTTAAVPPPKSAPVKPETPSARRRPPNDAPLPVLPNRNRTRGRGTALLVLALLVLLAFWAHSCSRPQDTQNNAAREETPAPQTTPTRTTETAIERAPEVEEALILQPEISNQRPRNATIATKPDWPTLDLPRSTINYNENTLQITFAYGLFASGTRLQEAARNDLLNLARQLGPQLEAFTVIVEGHTDTIPVRPDNEQFIDNFSLGLARAETVKHFLADQGGLPAGRIHTASAGQSEPPYPNDTPENRARNRTVIISIIP